MATENHSKLQNNVRIRLLKEVSRPTQANERSPTVTSRDGRTSSWLEVANRRRRRDGKSATRRRRSDRQTGIEVQCRA